MSAVPASIERLEELVDERTRELLARRRQRSFHRRGWWVRRALAAADLIGLVLAFAVAERFYGVAAAPAQNALASLTENAVFIASLPVWLLLAKLYGLYDRDEERADHTTSDDLVRVFHLVTVVVWLLFVVSVLSRAFSPVPVKLFVFWMAAVVLVVAGRVIARTLCRRRFEYLQNAIIVGAGDVGQMIAKKLINHPEYGINLVGFIDAEPRERREDLEHLALLGSLDSLTHVARLLDVERVIFAFSNEAHESILESVEDLRRMDMQVDIVPRLFESLGPSLQVHAIEGLPLVGLRPTHLSTSSLFVKRMLDVVASALGLIVLAPLIGLVGFLIKLDSRGPVFYRHERVGLRGRPFRLFKFRTMFLRACRGADYGGASAEDVFRRIISDPLRHQEFEASYKIQNDPRVTRVGRILRKLSIDELPQLINVLLGDMSLVGPRPVTEEELERYGEGLDPLLSIRPGITGYWQINGRSSLDYEDRVRLDLAYVSGWSLTLDLEILAKTARVLLSARGAV